MTGSLGLIPDETVSQGVAKRMVYAGVHARSFAESSGFCVKLAELGTQGRRIARLAKKIGTERVEQRDLETESWQNFSPKQRAIFAIAEPPKCVAVSMDGGRIQIRDRRAAEAALPQRVKIGKKGAAFGVVVILTEPQGKPTRSAKQTN